METWLLWDCLTEETRQKLIEAGWKAPSGISSSPITLNSKIESLEEIDRLMRKPPENPKQVV